MPPIDIAELRRMLDAATPMSEHRTEIERRPDGSGAVWAHGIGETASRRAIARFAAGWAGCSSDRECWIAARNALPALLDRIEALEAENTVLRGLVQCNPDWRCPYGQPVAHIAECPHGFPGCACADDRLAAMTKAEG